MNRVMSNPSPPATAYTPLNYRPLHAVTLRVSSLARPGCLSRPVRPPCGPTNRRKPRLNRPHPPPSNYLRRRHHRHRLRHRLRLPPLPRHHPQRPLKLIPSLFQFCLKPTPPPAAGHKLSQKKASRLPPPLCRQLRLALYYGPNDCYGYWLSGW